jgi:hypothetical protein
MRQSRVDRHLRPVLGGLVACLIVLVATFPVAAFASSTAKTPILLAGNGLGVVRFGSSVSSVTSAVSARLGPPTGRPDAGCVGGYTEVAWHDLIAQFRHGRFTGYRYWVNSSGSPPPSASTVSPKLQTAKGISLGSTFAQVRRRYRLTQTGTDFWKAANNIVFVLDSMAYPSPPSSPVYEIKTYGVCPAAI